MSFLLNVSDVLNYVVEGSRKLIEGENIVNSNDLIMYCGITNERDEKKTLIFLYVKSSDLFGSPHKIKVIIIKNTDKYKKIDYEF